MMGSSISVICAVSVISSVSSGSGSGSGTGLGELKSAPSKRWRRMRGRLGMLIGPPRCEGGQLCPGPQRARGNAPGTELQ